MSKRIQIKRDPTIGLSVNSLLVREGVGGVSYYVDAGRSNRVIKSLAQNFSIHNKAEKANDERFRIDYLYSKVGRSR